jgi:hypothetical protein
MMGKNLIHRLNIGLQVIHPATEFEIPQLCPGHTGGAASAHL